jgi:hypothetical protein
LNAYLERCCREDQGHVLAGRSGKIGAAMLVEQSHLLPLAAEPFDLAEISFPTVDGLRCLRVRTNRYSVPLQKSSHSGDSLLRLTYLRLCRQTIQQKGEARKRDHAMISDTQMDRIWGQVGCHVMGEKGFS